MTRYGSRPGAAAAQPATARADHVPEIDPEVRRRLHSGGRHPSQRVPRREPLAAEASVATTLTELVRPGVADGVVIDLVRDVVDITRPSERVADIAIVGLGYVGLPTALANISAGKSVIGIDVSDARLDAIVERSVDLTDADRSRLTEALGSPELQLSNDPRDVSNARAVFICVPTPVDRHLVPDVGALSAACESVVRHATRGQTIVLTSTSYVGTTRDLLIRPLTARGLVPGRDVFVAFSPERIDPANLDFPQEAVPRVVGGATPACREHAAGVISHVAPRVHQVSSPEAAELTKLSENVFRAVNAALANELAEVARSVEVDILEVIEAAATKPFGYMPFYPGPGVGGHCIPCDPHYLLWEQRSRHRAYPLIEAAMHGIAARPEHVVTRACEVLSSAGRGLADARVLVVGVSYKPGVADVRESPALEIIEALTERGARVEYYDPLVSDLRRDDGTSARSSTAPWNESWDLVLTHTLHPGCDYDWIVDHPLILDATYRLPAPHRHVV
jgi:nucleotide sugar dehydrogenase